MDDLGNLSAFLKAVEKGSLTAAATVLNCSTSTISKRIKQLEHSVGATLLNRSTHGNARPTEAGAAYFERVRLIIHELDSARETVKDVVNSIDGRLKVHLTPGTGQTIVLPAVLKFMRAYPDMLIELSVQPEDYDILSKGFDVTIHSKGNDAEDIGYASVEARPLTHAHYVICASRDYLERHGTPQQPEELEHHNCLVSIRQPSPYKWWFRRGHKKYSVNVKGSLESDNWVTVYEAAKAGIGIARMLRPDSEPGLGDDLQPLFSKEVVSQRSIWALTPRMNPMPKKVDLFLRFLEANLGEVPSEP